MKHIYMGEGKGKTTAAVGLAVRCAGSGRDVLFTQFMKPSTSSELELLEDMDHMQLWLCPGQFAFSTEMAEDEKEEAALVYERYLWDILRMVLQGQFRMLVLDEVLNACTEGFIEEAYLLECIEQMPDDLEIVMTGRYPSACLLEQADYITEMRKVKHPFDQGVKARKGIEF